MAEESNIVEKKEPSTLSKTLKTDMLSMPVIGQTKESQQFTKTAQPYIEKAAEAGGEVKRAEINQQAGMLGAQAQATRQYGEQTKGLVQEAENKELEYPRPEFHPTKENAESLGQLFSMVATFGVMLGGSGKLASQNALGAMSGMLKGWQDGRKDLYERELKEFDKEYKRIQDIRTDIQNRLQRSLQLASTDKEAAMLEGQQAAALAGADSMVKALVNQGKTQAALDLVKQAENIDQQVRQRQQQAAQHEQNLKLQRERLDLEKLKLTQGGGKGQGLNGRYAFNITEASKQAGQDLINITMMPKGTVLGTFADLTGKGGDTLIASLRNTFTRSKLTSEDQRQFQQLISGFDNNMSRALGGGYANSSAKAAVKAYQEQVAREGDSPLAMATFLARSKQELQILVEAFKDHPGANQGEIQQLNDMMSKINQAVPFNVNDVTTASGRGRETISSATKKMILPKAPTLQEFLTEAKKANPNATEDQLTQYYNLNYGAQ